MRLFLLAIVLAYTLPTLAQQPTPPPAGSNWQHVEVLPAGTSIHVNTKTGNQVCDLKSATDDTLTCTHNKDFTFQRSEIKSIKLAKRYRSAATGVAIGAAVGITAVETAWKRTWEYPPFTRGSAAAFVGVPFAIIGGVVGHTTDFTSSTIYKAP